MNQHLRTVIIAPMTTSLRPYATRVTVKFQSKQGQVALDQIRPFTGKGWFGSSVRFRRRGRTLSALFW
jgi:mRNA-degrading endonuclease toxin of MazEF toxin-antitoxin module